MVVRGVGENEVEFLGGFEFFDRGGEDFCFFYEVEYFEVFGNLMQLSLVQMGGNVLATYGGVIVEDATGRAFVFNGKGDDCRVGDMVVLNGLAGVPNPHGHIPWMWNVSVRVVGRGTAPVPRDIRLALRKRHFLRALDDI